MLCNAFSFSINWLFDKLVKVVIVNWQAFSATGTCGGSLLLNTPFLMYFYNRNQLVEIKHEFQKIIHCQRNFDFGWLIQYVETIIGQSKDIKHN